MNKYIEQNSKKFLVMLLLICVIFFVIIIKAFEYIPVADDDAIASRNNVEKLNKPAENSDEQTDNIEEKNEKKTLNINLTPDFVEKADKKADANSEQKPVEQLESISELPSEAVSSNAQEEKVVELTPEEKAEKAFYTAQKYKQEKQYVKALEEYQKIPTITSDNQTVARSYEEIATIYAIVKRYGTALSFAQKAYNLSPSSSREMLLARLYYKTGDIDKATRRINNVLQRDFSSDK